MTEKMKTALNKQHGSSKLKRIIAANHYGLLILIVHDYSSVVCSANAGELIPWLTFT